LGDSEISTEITGSKSGIFGVKKWDFWGLKTAQESQGIKWSILGVFRDKNLVKKWSKNGQKWSIFEV